MPRLNETLRNQAIGMRHIRVAHLQNRFLPATDTAQQTWGTHKYAILQHVSKIWIIRHFCFALFVLNFALRFFFNAVYTEFAAFEALVSEFM